MAKTKLIFRRIMAVVLIFAFSMMLPLTIYAGGKQTGNVSKENQAFIHDLGTGYNLGNALDVCDWNTKFQNRYGVNTQTLWWGAIISQDFIKMLKNEGFGVIRVPVTYMNHIDESGNVDQAWLNRVKEVATWIIQNDMYCIVDIHHDTGNSGWIMASSGNFEGNRDRVANMVNQIADAFRDYDNRLILEGFNEIVNEARHWDNAPLDAYDTHNRWNQLFVDTVRATGGNNASRYLLVNIYAATPNNANLENFKMPNDIIPNRIIVGVHNYTMAGDIKGSFERIKVLTNKGYPVIIGEFGSTASANYDRAQKAKEYVALCKDYGFCPIWWDNGEKPGRHQKTSFALFDRKNCTAYFPDIVNAITLK